MPSSFKTIAVASFIAVVLNGTAVTALELQNAHALFETNSAKLVPDAEQEILRKIKRSGCRTIEVTGAYDPGQRVDAQLKLIDQRSRVIERMAKSVGAEVKRSVYGYASFTQSVADVRISVSGVNCGAGMAFAPVAAGAGLMLSLLAAGGASSTQNTN